jgi:hypothetical protein
VSCVQPDTDDEAETETAVKRRESSTLAVDGEMDDTVGRPRRATVSGSGSRPSLRAKQLLVLQQQEGRPKSCIVSTGGEEATAGSTHRSLPTSNLPSPEHTAAAGLLIRKLCIDHGNFLLLSEQFAVECILIF